MEVTSVFLNDAAPTAINVMLDLETWGTAPGSALRSIGAVMFDPHTDEIGETFYANIDDQSCLDAGLVKDPSTVAWWAKQTQQAQDSLVRDQLHFVEVANNFHSWFRQQRGMFVWSQGANFDGVLWEVAVRRVGLSVPWKFWDTRCTRTAYDMGCFNPRSIRRVGTHHNALDDAIHQAKCVQAAYRRRAA